MPNIRHTRLALLAADRARFAALEADDFDSAVYRQLSAELDRARRNHRAAVAAYRRES